MARLFRKRAIYLVEAVQFDGTLQCLQPLVGDQWEQRIDGTVDPTGLFRLRFAGQEMRVLVNIGDWIVKDRFFFGCKPDIFTATFEEVTHGTADNA